MWGEEYEAFILQNRIEDIDDFKEKYLTIQAQIDDNQELIDSYNEKVEYYTMLKEQWSDLTSAYEDEVNEQYALQILGANWEYEVLSGRVDTLESFKNSYIAIQQAIAQAAVDSANAQIEALNAVKNAETTASTTTTVSSTVANVSSGSGSSSSGSSSIAKPGSSSSSTYYGGKYSTNLPTAYHEGLKEGPVNSKNDKFSSDFDVVAKYGLKDDETVAVLKNGEAVLTQLQQSNVADALRLLQDYVAENPITPDIGNVLNSGSVDKASGGGVQNVVQNITVTLPNVTNEAGFNNFAKKLERLKLDALQYSHKRG